MSGVGKYQQLIDAQTWAFIEDANAFYPPDTAEKTIAEQRRIYNTLCRSFFAGYPDGVVSVDTVLATQDVEISLRDYSQPGISPAAHILYFHGGGFVVGDLESHDDICAELCARTGFSVTSVDYRLAPEHVYPADFNDARAALSSVIGSASLPVIVVGDSAGGNLAAALCHATRWNKYRPCGQVLIYPGLDSVFDHGSYLEHADAPMLSTHDMEFYLAMRTGGEKLHLSDPLCFPLQDKDFSGLPPTVVFSAQCDPLCDDGSNYCDKISGAGGKAHWINEQGLVHGYLRARHSVVRAKDSFSRIVAATKMLGHARWEY